MVSLLTNAAAMSALRVLTATQRSLGTVEKQASTGLRVADASDNAAYWSIGVAMSSRIGAVSAVQDSLALTLSIANVTAAALKSIIGTAQSIQADVVTASQPGVDRGAVQRSIAAKQASILGTAESASFNGVNWLTLDTPYTITDHLISTEDHSASSNDAATIQGSQVAPTDLTDTVRYTDDDTLVVTGPNGYTNTITSRLENGETRTKLTGSSAPTITAGSTTLTVNPGTSLAAGQVEIGPAAYGDSGLTQLTGDEFSIHNVGYSLNSTWDYSRTYAGSASNGQDTSTSQRYFFSGATDAAFVASIPGSLLTPLLGLDVTQASALSTAPLVVSETLSGLVAKAAAVGSLQTRISVQQDFNAALSDALISGVGSLVDADMNVASTRLQALQTQEQLGVQALSIANDNSSMLLKLFAG